MIYDCIIIGAGAAGLYCSSSFQRPVKGLILEKTKRPGTKLLMSGGGQCNVTHGGSIKDFIGCYGKNGSKVRSCLYRYNNQQLMEFLHDGGVETITREDGKVFPKSMDAHDILNLLLTKSRQNGFDFKYESPVEKIRRTEAGLWQVAASENVYLCRNLVIATGGCSYPTTGSDGAMFFVLQRELDLEITELRPALAPVYVIDYPYGELAGLAFENTHLSVWRNGKKITEGSGDLLFTHENFSGPLILNQSKDIKEEDRIVLNYLYPADQKEILAKMQELMKGNRMSLVNTLSKELHLPKSFMQSVISESGNSLKRIAAKLTTDTFIVRHTAVYHKAMVTGGGIALKELNLKSMELKRYPHLYAIGEVLDIDGWTGGYNLQFAYSSARAACAAIGE